jgi:RNA polymerase sigma-70 factor (ECF subfamily)
VQRIDDSRFSGVSNGRFQRRARLERDERPGELKNVIARAKAGDREAFRYLYQRFAGNIYGYTRSIVRDEHDAEDVTQQVFTRMMTAIANYEDRGVPFSAWLLRIAHNMSIDHMRRRVVVAEDVHQAEQRVDSEHAHHLSLSLRQALAELPEGQREVVLLRHVAGWSPTEIAEKLGRSEDAVHGVDHRGRRQLKATLRSLDATPVAA